MNARAAGVESPLRRPYQPYKFTLANSTEIEYNLFMINKEMAVLKHVA